ncbi:hypothetical protein EDWATA_01093 [Edwardsiella tarda ATCC 23685]|uniref:Uncharacterized protein n=1 Tax=Edwardsiella tarda ATCC 23685 TaxID=500638 RepID=D4F2Z2_EDWTA|nr:hypothetical protein EDWATA_01093 [Edwardsiella tarda ATCC 23685]
MRRPIIYIKRIALFSAAYFSISIILFLLTPNTTSGDDHAR